MENHFIPQELKGFMNNETNIYPWFAMITKTECYQHLSLSPKLLVCRSHNERDTWSFIYNHESKKHSETWIVCPERNFAVNTKYIWMEISDFLKKYFPDVSAESLLKPIKQSINLYSMDKISEPRRRVLFIYIYMTIER
jgi:hypothetical protein